MSIPDEQFSRSCEIHPVWRDILHKTIFSIGGFFDVFQLVGNTLRGLGGRLSRGPVDVILAIMTGLLTDGVYFIMF